jgi:uncharacterized membrane protein YuzA (DUF378 family)
MDTKTVHKLYWDYEKEERWLNHMAAQGFALADYTWGTYRFERSAPGEWIYRVELLSRDVSGVRRREYLDFMRDAGIQSVATHLSWVYFRKPAADGPFELFSDLDSRIAHYQRVLAVFGSLTVALIPVTTVNLINLMHGDRSMAFVLPLMALQSAIVALMATQSVRFWRRVESLKTEKDVFE